MRKRLITLWRIWPPDSTKKK